MIHEVKDKNINSTKKKKSLKTNLSMHSLKINIFLAKKSPDWCVHK